MTAKMIAGTSALLLVAIIAATGYQGWRVWQNAGEARNPPRPTPTMNGAKGQAPTIAQIIPLNLFGENRPEPEVVEQSTEDLPETNLSLTLRGVSASTKDDVGGALIETPDRQTSFFRAGATMPGNVVLHSVYANRVVLDRNGKLENLLFPEAFEDSSFVVVYDEATEDEYVEAQYEEPQYPEPQYIEPDYGEADSQEQAIAVDSAPAEEYQQPEAEQPAMNQGGEDPAMQALEEERKQQIRERLQRLREQIRARQS